MGNNFEFKLVYFRSKGNMICYVLSHLDDRNSNLQILEADVGGDAYSIGIN